MAYFPFQPGQQPMSSSQGVVIASDQTPVSVVGTLGVNPASVQLLGGTNVIGSVATLQGTNPWVVQLTSGSVITSTGNSSVQVVGIVPAHSVSGVGNFNVVPVGSIAGTYLDTTAVTSVTGVAILFKSSDNSSVMHAPSPSFPLPVVGSVSGTVTANPNPASVQLIGGTNVIGSVAALQGTNPWVIGNSSVTLMNGGNAIGSVTALQGTNPWVIGNTSVSGVGNFNVIPVGSIAGTYLDTTAVTSVTGLAMLFKSSDTTSIMHSPSPSFPLPIVGSVSGTIGASILGVGILNNIDGANAVLGLVVQNNNRVYNGATWDRQRGDSVSGTVVSVYGTVLVTTTGSILGNYGVNSVFASNNTGFADWAVRNDTVASLITTDKTYGPQAVDSSGRQLTKPFAPIESSVWATASTVNAGAGTNNAASVRVFAAPGAGLKNYITDFMIANTGSVATLVSFIDNDGSVLAKTIAPAGGGSNAIGLSTPIVNVSTNQPIGMISGTASSILHVWAAGYKAP